MNNQKIADLLFPHINISAEEVFAKYPKRSLKEGQIVTRFAPSPTGYVHIGNFFQAFISYNLAKNSNGIYFLRTIKRVQFGMNKVTLVSENAEKYPPRVFTGEESSTPSNLSTDFSISLSVIPFLSATISRA